MIAEKDSVAARMMQSNPQPGRAAPSARVLTPPRARHMIAVVPCIKSREKNGREM